MSEPRFADNPHYRAYEGLLIDLHHLFLEGKDESPGADALREEMDVHGSWLSPDEEDRLGGLSGDLYMIQEDEVFEVVQEPIAEWEQKLASHWGAGDLPALLYALRRRPEAVPSAEIARIRGIVYHQLGDLPAAVEFLRFAIAHKPTDGFAKYVLLEVLSDLDQVGEALSIASEFGARSAEDAWWLTRYVMLLSDSSSELIDHWKRALEGLKLALQESEGLADEPSHLRFLARVSLVLCYLEVNDFSGARNAFQSLTTLEPMPRDDDALRFVRDLSVSLGLADPTKSSLRTTRDTLRVDNQEPTSLTQAEVERKLAPAIRDYLTQNADTLIAEASRSPVKA